MPTCKPKLAQPCFFYRNSADQQPLNTFLVHCAGSQAIFEPTSAVYYRSQRPGRFYLRDVRFEHPLFRQGVMHRRSEPHLSATVRVGLSLRDY